MSEDNGLEGEALAGSEREDVAQAGGEGETAGLAAEKASEYCIGELSSNEVLERLSSAAGFGDSMKALESRTFGRIGSMEQNLRELSDRKITQAGFDETKFERLRKYDSDLADALIADMKEAIRFDQVNEEMLAPMLEKSTAAGKQRASMDLIEAIHGDLDEFLPFEGQMNERAKGYSQWFGTQDYQTQQALRDVDGPRAVRALNSFKEWEKVVKQERDKAAEQKKVRLAGAAQPKGGAAGKDEMLASEEQGFLSAFKDG